MDHEPVLISTIAIGLVAAFVGGLIAQRLRLPSIVGYIAAGVALGPFTPGVIADAEIAGELAEIGVILLMFGVGIEFSIKDLMAVRRIAVPGAIGQFAIATLLGIGLGTALGWGVGGGLILGLAISVASTVVLLRTLNDRNELDTPQGRIAVGWLIVEDLFTVVILVVLPTIAPLIGGVAATSGGTDSDVLATVGSVVLAVGKAAGFAVLMIVVGARLVPWLLNLVARDGSRELFTLAVLAIALGIAFVSSTVFGVSFALGAFLAGAVVGESDMSHQAAADALPLRDAFAVLFFVSVGMLLDPSFLVTYPLAILAMVGLIVVSKALVKFAIVTLFGYPLRTGLTVGVGLAQIGEFSFILGTVGATLGLLPAEGFQLIVAGSLLSIALNPFLFRAIDPLDRRLRAAAVLTRWLERRAGDRATLETTPEQAPLRGHAILVGYGRVGRLIGPALDRRGFRYVVLTLQRREVDQLRARGVAAIYGDASNADVLERAHVETARLVIVASSDPHVTRLVVERALAANPAIDFVVRTHSDTEAAHLRAVTSRIQTVHGERELAVQMVRYSLRRFGVDSREAEAIAQGLRRHTAPTTASVGDVREGGPLRRGLDRIRGRRASATNEVGEP
jgi:CPA2 family monovalent cation:H+ antiporter-2